MGSWIANMWQYNTVRVTTDLGNLGTGFLVLIENEEGNKKRYLITNRHVIEQVNDDDSRTVADTLTAEFYYANDQGVTESEEHTMFLEENQTSHFRFHPSQIVDVCSVDVTSLINDVENAELRYLDILRLSTQRLVSEMELSWGDEILTIGYPQGIAQGPIAFPLIQPCMIASNPRMPITLEDEDGNEHTDCPAFYIGSETLGGQSGSIVVLKPVVGRYRESLFDMNPAEPVLVGIISDGFDHIPLSIAWNGDAVIQTILEFYRKTNESYEEIYQKLVIAHLTRQGYAVPKDLGIPN